MHGFNRIAVYPLNAKKCLSNCDSTTLKQFNVNDIENIDIKIPGLAEIFLNDGQVTETQMNEAGIPSISTDDRRSTPKDKRTQNHRTSK